MKSQRIAPVKQLAEQKEQKSAEQLGKARQSFVEAQQKLHELTQYKADYIAEFQFKAKKGISGAQLQHYQTFMIQLDKAIEVAQKQIHTLQYSVRQQKEQWQKHNQRSQVVTSYHQKLKSNERKKAEKLHDSQMADDITANSHHRNSD